MNLLKRIMLVLGKAEWGLRESYHAFRDLKTRMDTLEEEWEGLHFSEQAAYKRRITDLHEKTNAMERVVIRMYADSINEDPRNVKLDIPKDPNEPITARVIKVERATNGNA